MDENKIVQKFPVVQEKKHVWRFDASKSDVNPPMTSLYISKALIKSGVPTSITVTVEVEY